MLRACRVANRHAKQARARAVGGVFTPTVFVDTLLGLIAVSAAHALWSTCSLPKLGNQPQDLKPRTILR